MTNPRLIVLEEEEAERLRSRAEVVLDPDHLAYLRDDWGDDTAAVAKEEALLDLTLVARYEQGRVLGRKERARFLTPPTQRSDPE